MPLYRYFNDIKYARDFADGKFRLSAASHYRQEKSDRGDSSEGAPLLFTKEDCSLTPRSLDLLSQFPLPQLLSSVGTLQMKSGQWFELVPIDHYALCFSNNPLLSKFGQHQARLDEGDLITFGQRVADDIRNQTIVRAPGFDFEVGFICKDIRYEVINFQKGIEVIRGELPDDFNSLYFEKIFTKPNEYSDEEEIRPAFFYTSKDMQVMLSALKNANERRWIVNLPQLSIDIGPCPELIKIDGDS
jgi:hypothetical protein